MGVDDYGDDEADEVIDAAGKYICPGFIDGHIQMCIRDSVGTIHGIETIKGVIKAKKKSK